MSNPHAAPKNSLPKRRHHQLRLPLGLGVETSIHQTDTNHVAVRVFGHPTLPLVEHGAKIPTVTWDADYQAFVRAD